MGRFWSISAGNPPKIGPEWVDSGRRTVCDCGTIDGCFSQIRPFSEIDSFSSQRNRFAPSEQLQLEIFFAKNGRRCTA